MIIETSARLHLSLIDMNGSMGRIDGGIGLTLSEPSLKIECEENSLKSNVIFNQSTQDNSQIKECESKIMYANDTIQKYLGINKNYTFNVKEIYTAHKGLGLGTQILLSTAKLVAEHNDADLNVYDLARIIHRGSTSGIGVYSFSNGGLIVDGGHKTDNSEGFLPSSESNMSPPPLLARYDFPRNWKILVVTPKHEVGLHGKEEVNIFKTKTPIDLSDVEKISYLTLMKLMPAVLEEDLLMFAEAINNIQSLGFKKIEKSLQSTRTTNILDHMSNEGIPAVGMSSFGPTCFGITDGNCKNIKKDLTNDDNIVIETHGKNHGFTIKK